MSGSWSRNKGRGFEQKLARIFKAAWRNAKRWIQTQTGGKEGGDIEGTPWHIEASKGGESIWAKWKQACDDSQHTGKPPVVIKQRDREKPVVMMGLDTFLDIAVRSDFDEMCCPRKELLAAYRTEFGGKDEAND